MNIADQIANILQKNPKGLKASEIASQIGYTRKVVNSYLYAHKDMYEQHDGYIWTAKSTKRNSPPSPCKTPALPANSYSVNIQQSAGNTFVSTLTIMPNSAGYQISSTNNQIICCDCNKFISIHAPACPFCGCPVHYMADTYYKHYGAEAIRKAQQQHQEQQNAEELKRQQAEKERRNAIARKCYLNANEPHRDWNWFEKLCLLEIDVFEQAIKRAEFLSQNFQYYPRISDVEWYTLIISDELSYRKNLIKLKQDKQEECARAMIADKASDASSKINILRIKDVCKKSGLSEEIITHFLDGCYSADEVQARIDAARYFAKTYPHLKLDEERLMLLSVEQIKNRVNSLSKSFPRF